MVYMEVAPNLKLETPIRSRHFQYGHVIFITHICLLLPLIQPIPDNITQ